MKNQTEINRRNSARHLAEVITANFDSAHLLTFCCSNICFKKKYADCRYKELMRWARRAADRPFHYVRFFVPAPAPSQVAFCLITDLRSAICGEITSRWLVGRASIKRLTPEELEDLTRIFPADSWNFLEKNRQAWSASRGLIRVPPS